MLFAEPSAMTTSGTPLPPRCAATGATVPSPPATATRSAGRASRGSPVVVGRRRRSTSCPRAPDLPLEVLLGVLLVPGARVVNEGHPHRALTSTVSRAKGQRPCASWSRTTTASTAPGCNARPDRATLRLRAGGGPRRRESSAGHAITSRGRCATQRGSSRASRPPGRWHAVRLRRARCEPWDDADSSCRASTWVRTSATPSGTPAPSRQPSRRRSWDRGIALSAPALTRRRTSPLWKRGWHAPSNCSPATTSPPWSTSTSPDDRPACPGPGRPSIATTAGWYPIRILRSPAYWFTVVPLDEPEEGTDLWAVANGLVSLTPLRLDLTDHEALAAAPPPASAGHEARSGRLTRARPAPGAPTSLNRAGPAGPKSERILPSAAGPRPHGDHRPFGCPSRLRMTTEG